MSQVIFHPAAQEELLAAAVYYENCRRGLGAEFLSFVESTVADVAAYPELGRVIRQPYRRLLVARFPYGVVYRCDHSTLRIIAIMHLNRKPGYWVEK
ncbi:MAG: type II toxin-antitoxin system RelE/ParE family toxin [Planctomycetota bacterium]